MITLQNPMGTISMTSDYFAELVSQVFGSDFPEKGVRVTQSDRSLTIELHIKVGYGLNIATIVKSITHKVKHEVEKATGLTVARIEVSVDDIVAD